MPRVDFSEMHEWNLMQEIWELDILLATYIDSMTEMTFQQFENDMDNMFERLRGMIGDEDAKQFLMTLPGPGIMLRRLETTSG